MKIIQKIKDIFKKPSPVEPSPVVMIKPPEVKITTIPTEHLRAKVSIPHHPFLLEHPDELENQARNLLLKQIEPVIKNKLEITIQQSCYGEPYEVTADIFIGFGGNSE